MELKIEPGKPTVLATSMDQTYVWAHPMDDPEMMRLYDLAKRYQWNVDDLAWKESFDPERGLILRDFIGGYDSIADRLGTKEKLELSRLYVSWLASRLVHGEHMATMLCSQLLLMVPDADSKLFQSLQVVDEARHVEFFMRYVNERGGKFYPPAAAIIERNQAILGDVPWYVKVVGLQLAAETWATHLFKWFHEYSIDPVLREGLNLVARDESRHMAFGSIVVPKAVDQMSDQERNALAKVGAFFIVKSIDSVWPDGAYADMGFTPPEIARLKDRWLDKVNELGLVAPVIKAFSKARLMTDDAIKELEKAKIPARHFLN